MLALRVALSPLPCITHLADYVYSLPRHVYLIHFVLHVSVRGGLPTFPCVTNCRANGLGRGTYLVWSNFVINGKSDGRHK
jgi:hypothetical protein